MLHLSGDVCFRQTLFAGATGVECDELLVAIMGLYRAPMEFLEEYRSEWSEC